MRRLTYVAMIVGVAAVFGLGWSANELRSDDRLSEEPNAVAGNASNARPTDRTVAPRARPVVKQALPADKLAAYRCNPAEDEQLECDTNVLKAATNEEAAWLAKNGFPSVDEVTAVDTHSANLSELKDRVKQGDLTAFGLYGRALTNDGQFDQASNVLADGISKGSLFAIYELSRVYGAKDFANRDVRESAGYLRALYLLGDRKASMRFYSSYPTFGTTDFAIADMRGQELFHAVMLQRERGGAGNVMIRP